MFTQLKTTAGIVQIRGDMADGLTTVRREIATIRMSDEKITAFLGSTPAILSTLPPNIKLSENLIFKSYVRLHVGKIDEVIKHLASTQSYPVEEPWPLAPRLPTVISEPYTQEEIEDLQDDVTAQLITIREHLKTKHNQLSILRGAWAMIKLSIGLRHLRMFEESVIIGLHAVDLYRTLAKVHPDVYTSHLIQALYSLSASFVSVGPVGLENAYQIIQECVTHSRRLATSTPTSEAQFEVASLVSYSAYVARLNGDGENALRDAEESTQTLQRLTGNAKVALSAEVLLERIRGRVVMTYAETHIHDFAHALKELHCNLSDTERKEQAAEAGIMSLELFRTLTRRHNHLKMHFRVAEIALSLSKKKFRQVISLAQALSYAEESVKSFEYIYGIIGVPPENLIISLATNGEVLCELERFDEAYVIYQRIADVIPGFRDNPGLCAHSLQLLVQGLYWCMRYEEAAKTGEHLVATYRPLLSQHELAITHSCISASFLCAGHYIEGIQAAEETVSICRALALQAEKYTRDIGDSLLLLARGLFYTNDYRRAVNTCNEASKLYSVLVVNHPDALGDCKGALQLNMQICLLAEMDSIVLEASQEAIQQCIALLHQFPAQEAFLIDLIIVYANLSIGFDRLSDGTAAIEKTLSWFADHPARDPKSVELHIECLRISGLLLDVQGYPDRAFRRYAEVIKVASSFISDCSVARQVLRSKIRNCADLHAVGQTSLAMLEIDDCLSFAHEHKLEKDPGYSFCLDVASRIYRSSGRGEDILTILEGRVSLTPDIGFGQVGLSPWILSDLLSDAGREAEALQVAQNAVQRAKEKIKAPFRISDQQLFKEAQYSLAQRLFANNDLSQAQKLLVEARNFYVYHAQTRNMWFVNLAIILWAEGILKCASSRHEEGIIARTKLDELQKRLRLAFPSLNELVDLALNRERNFASWKNILHKFNLTCGHQEE